MARRQHQPDMLRLFFESMTWGAVISALFTGLVIWADVAGIGGLLMRAQAPLLWVAFMWISQVGLFGAIQFAWRLTEMAKDDDDDDSDGTVYLAEPVPVRINRD